MDHFTKLLEKYWTLGTRVAIMPPHNGVTFKVVILKLPFLTNWLAEAKFNSTNSQERGPYGQSKKWEHFFFFF